MPVLQEIKLWAGQVEYEDTLDGNAKEVTEFMRLMPVTLTAGIQWAEAKGNWQSTLYVAGEPLDASWETDEDDVVLMLTVTTATRNQGEIEFRLALEDKLVSRLLIPVVDI